MADGQTHEVDAMHGLGTLDRSIATRSTTFGPLDAFTTCPHLIHVPEGSYTDGALEVGRWTEDAGFIGMLLHTDTGMVDPWLLAQTLVERTERLQPLVAVQPLYMHPYTAAKMVASIAFMHGRRIWLNFLAGGYRDHLAALGDETPHDDRYVRTTEYGRIMLQLLAGEAVTFEGKYYSAHNLRLTPAVPPELRPGILISGSSPAGMQAAAALGAVAVRYPEPSAVEENLALDFDLEFGIRIGILARESDEEAWHAALDRYPDDRKGRIKHQLVMKVTDSHWQHRLNARDSAEAAEGPYWLQPFQTGKTYCPYLVGSYETVASEVGRYTAAGFRTIIVDIPPSREELDHIGVVLERAARVAA
jgi:alkanesulfonate monooxygenase